MTQNTLHIVSFDNPYPPNYGGVIDVYYKVKALSESGYNIHLHCFVDGFQEVSIELESICEKVFFYPRKKINPFKVFSKYPYAVASRSHPDLLKNLNLVKAPILFEGLQTTQLVADGFLKSHDVFLRLHNNEAQYYAGLSKSETNFLKKFMYRLESIKFQHYQKKLGLFKKVFTLSISETSYVKNSSGNQQYIPVFHGNYQVESLSPFGKYAFYHGDLRIADNKKAVQFFFDLFQKIPDYNLVIAGNCNEVWVKQQIGNRNNISYIQIKNFEHLEELFAEAHLNIMLSFQESGTKLKLINALFKSRFCIVNSNMVDDPKIQALCIMATSSEDFFQAILKYKDLPFESNLERRKVLLEVLSDNENAKKMSFYES